MKNKVKKIIKFIGNNTFGFILGIIVAGGTVYAATVLNSNSISYDNSNSTLSSTNVQDAIDELYEKSETHCPDGYECVKSKILCIRGTTLPTTPCAPSGTTGYCLADGYAKNDTITYGSLGTNGKLTTGDLFICDVNGDGTYNASNEKFFYVSDYYDTQTKSFNSKYATLVFYGLVSDGSNWPLTGFNYSDGSGYKGPDIAKSELPKTTQWTNVTLKNTTRNITDASGKTIVSNYSYEGYAARLLTYQEVNSGCYDSTTSIESTKGLSNKCKFLFSSTLYDNCYHDVLLETLILGPNNNYNYVYYLDSSARRVRFGAANSAASNKMGGVKPAIDVKKSQIDY